jgi:Rieske Fe-S protein
MTVGSGVTVSPPNYQDSFGNDSIYIVQEAAGVFIAYSLSCTHQGCLVTQSGSGWRCACHGATYSATGGSPTSPANTPLQSYTVVCVDATGVTLALT